mgnify:CR=1 FL=1
MILPVVRNQKNKFTVVRVHYSADPDKNTPEWIAMAKPGMSENAWRREYEIDYTLFAGKPFYQPEFKAHNIALAEIPYKPMETLYRGWDFGFHHPALLITKINEFDQWCWLEAIVGEDEQIMDFGKRVRTHCLATYPGAKWIDACDIAGMQVSDKSERTSVQILNALGIYPQARKQPIKQGAEIIRQKLNIRVDGKPGLIINPNQKTLIKGFQGGLHYPEAKEGRTENEFYEKEGFYEHPFDAARYLATEMFSVIGQFEGSNEIARDPMKYMWRDGRPVDQQNPNYDEDYPTSPIEDEMKEYF